ncbi:MAG: M67 family metallopeptidase [Cyanobacteria bacterium J06588_5]
MVLALSSEQLAAISVHAERVYPEECCGLLVGKIHTQETEQTKQLTQLVPLDNEWTPEVLPTAALAQPSRGSIAEQSVTKSRRYWINPKDMLRAQKQAREDGLDIIGIYHSHPDHVAVPSECDRALAWPIYAYVIVSVCEGKAVDVQNWTLDSDHLFQPEPLKVSPSSAKDRMPVSA